MRFQGRIDEYNRLERRRTVHAIWTCADTLSRKFGHTPEDYVIGSDVFTADEAGELVSNLRTLNVHAEEAHFNEGVTAVCALQAIAALILARVLPADEATHVRIDLKREALMNMLRPLFDEYAEMESAAQ